MRLMDIEAGARCRMHKSPGRACTGPYLKSEGASKAGKLGPSEVFRPGGKTYQRFLNSRHKKFRG